MTLADAAQRCLRRTSPAQAGNGAAEGLRSWAGAARAHPPAFITPTLRLSTAGLNTTRWLKRERAGKQPRKTPAESCEAGSEDAGIARASPPSPGHGTPSPPALLAPAAAFTEGPAVAPRSPGAGTPSRRHPEPSTHRLEPRHALPQA